MSWFQDLAGKAENILNKIDQNAATVLQQQKDEKDEYFKSNATLVEVKCENEKLQQQSGIPMVQKPRSSTLTLKKSPSIGNNIAKVIQPQTQIKFEDSLQPSQQQTIEIDEIVDKPLPSNSTSRRSSFSSKADGTVIENGSNKSVVATPTPIIGRSSQFSINAEQELSAVKIVLNDIKSERDEIKEELESLREQVKNENSHYIIKELEEMCLQLKADITMLKQKNETLEKSNVNYIKTISDMESKLSKLNQSEADLLSKLSWAKQETEQSQYELQQYRSRAQSTLQMKDKLIQQLKCDHQMEAGNRSANVAQLTTESIELENMKTERAGLLEEIRIQNDQLEQIRRYVDKLEHVQKEQQNEFQDKLKLVNKNLKSEEQKWMQYENDNKSHVQELTMVREEMTRLQKEYANKIHQKETELTKLRQQFSQKSSIHGMPNGLEERVQSLTQSLVQKQNSLESVTADRNALRLQLEKIEIQHRQTMIQLRQQRPQVINVNDTDDAKAQVPIFLQENPFDTGVARRVKRAYSTLDSMGVRVGLLLRRYPLIRILALFYVVLLHLWVMVVLFTSTPN